jgi:hypothetical protein
MAVLLDAAGKGQLEQGDLGDVSRHTGRAGDLVEAGRSRAEDGEDGSDRIGRGRGGRINGRRGWLVRLPIGR